MATPTPPEQAPVAPTPAAGPSASSARFAPPKLPVKENPFVYLGIPQWVFDYKPKPPSRNMSIFLSVTVGLTSAYIYDRRECKRIQQEHLDKVRWMSEAPLETTELARKVRVLAARVPEDGETDRSARWFKRYIRPYLVAAGVDYKITSASAPGGLGRTIINEIRARRLSEAAREAASPSSSSSFSKSGIINSPLDEKDLVEQALELEGGLIVLGRGALKEYLWGLRKGYSEPIDLREEGRLEGLGLGAGSKRKDARPERDEEIVVRELEREDALAGVKAPFDDSEPITFEKSDDETANPAAGLQSIGYVPYSNLLSPPAPPPSSSLSSDESESPLILPPRQLPPQPPLLLVPFSHAFGIQRWPAKLVHFFNHRSDVRLGAEAALVILNNQTRAFDSPTSRDGLGNLQGVLEEPFVTELRVGGHKDTLMVEGTPTGSKDLDFMFDTEEPYHFRRSYRKQPDLLETQRRKYYAEELPPKVLKARELAAGRTPTKAESNNPPPKESELRKERLEKEVRWRHQLQGWAVRRAGSGIAWDEAWGNALGNEQAFRVFRDVTEGERANLEQQRRAAEAERARKETEQI